jgi:acetyltransferase
MPISKSISRSISRSISTRAPQRWTLRDGTPVRLRPIAPLDAAALKTLIENLSARDRRCRFHAGVGQIGAAWIERMANVQGADEHAWVVTIPSLQGDAVIADLRLHRCEKTASSELALMVAPAWRRHGLGQQGLHALSGFALSLGCAQLHGTVLRENTGMLALMASFGFQANPSGDDDADSLRLVYPLQERAPGRRAGWPGFAALCARSAAAAWRARLPA